MFEMTLLCVDQSLGRLDYDSLSDQALMEMLIDGMDEQEKQRYQDENKNFLDVCEWDAVECEGDRVTEIALSESKFTAKQFPFLYMPPLVTYFKILVSNLHGTLDTKTLPRNLTYFYVGNNMLNESVSFADFPPQIDYICLSYNAFCGKCALSDLPATVTDFYAARNRFCGEIALNDLPPAMLYLFLAGNALTGSINIERLPKSIDIIDLSQNSFSGEFHLHTFPEYLRRIDIRKNELSEIAVLAVTTEKMHFHLENDCIQSVVDEEGNRHKWHEKIVFES